MATVSSIASQLTSIKTKKVSNSIGSVRWLAPESTAKKPVFNEQSDIFSLGLVLWEIASRKIPFEDIKEDAQVIVLVKYENERPEISADTPKELAKLIECCWQEDPSKRPDLSEVIATLKSLLPAPSQSIHSPPSSHTKRMTLYFIICFVKYSLLCRIL